jgi:hypothetical protein
MKHPSYAEHDGCHNCHYVFKFEEFDCSPDFYCTCGDQENRPLSGSVYLGENFTHSEMGWDHAYDMWQKWSKDNRLVRPWGTCLNWGLK